MQDRQDFAAPDDQVRVLVVEDSVTISQALTEKLVGRGCKVLRCADGFEALSRIDEFLPDLIFTDVVMPRVDGNELISLIRWNPKFANTPIITLSSKSSVFDVAKSKLIGCNDYLTKPVSETSLYTVLDRHLPNKFKEMR